MKLNKYIYMFMTGAIILGHSACVDVNDWDVDSSYDRLFRPNGVKVSADATTAEISWDLSPNTNYYVIEINPTDSLYGQTEEPRESSIVYGIDKSITTSPVTIENLVSNTKYFIRVRACSDAQGNSHWNYLEAFSFRTRSENILNAVDNSQKGEDYITLSWAAGLAVTHIEYAEVIGTDDNNNAILGETNTLQLTADQITAGEATVNGLKASTSYQFTIYNQSAPRGTRTVTTALQAPEGNLKVQIPAGSTLTQEMLDSWANEGSVTVIFDAATEYTLEGLDPVTGDPAGLTIPNNLSITFFGSNGVSKTILKASREVLMGGIHSYIRFENVIVKDAGAQYLFNQGSDATVSELSFKDSEFIDFARNVVRLKDQKSITIDLLSFENCIITNQGGGGYPCIGLDAKEYTISKMVFTNTIFNTLSHNVIALNNNSRGCATVNSVDFNNCTFYNTVGATRYLVDAGSADQGPTVTFNNSILGKSYGATLSNGVWASTSRGVRSKSVVVNNTYMTADGIFGSNAIKGCIDYSGTSDDLFNAPANGDFTIKDGGFPEGIGASIQ